MPFTTFSSSFASAGPSAHSYATRLSSFASTCNDDEVVPRNRGPFPKPIQRPNKAPKANIGLGLGLPSDDLSSAFRESSEVHGDNTKLSSELPTGTGVVPPTKAELRSLRVAALRGLGIFLDENPRPATATTTTTTTTFSSAPSPPLLPTHRPSLARLQARHIAKAEDDEIINPTFFTHSPIPPGPTAPPSTPAGPLEAPSASTLPVPFPRPHAGCAGVKGKDVILIKNYNSSPCPAGGRDGYVVESTASPNLAFTFQPFSPMEEGTYHLPTSLLLSPNLLNYLEYLSFSSLYENSNARV